jgi:hypothetical protein
MIATAQPLSSKPFLVISDLQMQANNRNITNFKANFVMIRTDGSEHHSHHIVSCKAGNNTNFQINPKSASAFNGTANYVVSGTTKWPGADTIISIEKTTILTVQLQEQEVKQHLPRSADPQDCYDYY